MGMDDNVPDVCKVCGYIISPEEDAPEEICEKCQSRDTLKKYNFRDEQGHPLEDCEDYHRLLRRISQLLDENAELRKQYERDQREIESRKRENMINCEIIAGLQSERDAIRFKLMQIGGIRDNLQRENAKLREEIRSITTATAEAFDNVTGVTEEDRRAAAQLFEWQFDSRERLIDLLSDAIAKARTAGERNGRIAGLRDAAGVCYTKHAKYKASLPRYMDNAVTDDMALLAEVGAEIRALMEVEG